jgi:hypothetical protein
MLLIRCVVGMSVGLIFRCRYLHVCSGGVVVWAVRWCEGSYAVVSGVLQPCENIPCFTNHCVDEYVHAITFVFC